MPKVGDAPGRSGSSVGRCCGIETGVARRGEKRLTMLVSFSARYCVCGMRLLRLLGVCLLGTSVPVCVAGFVS